MRNLTFIRIAAALVLCAASAGGIGAQRTFVASYGADTNLCVSSVSPCRTLQRAHNLTNVGGELTVLDSENYSRLVITRSISIVASEGIHAQIAVPSGLHGIVINGAGINVTLRGLGVHGPGGNDGIRVAAGGSRVSVTDTTVRGSAGSGVQIDASATVVVDHSRIEGNRSGIVAVAPGGRLTVSDSRVGGSFVIGVLIEASATGTWDVAIARSNIEGNAVDLGASGIQVGGGVSGAYRAAITDNLVRGNGIGVFLMSEAGETVTAVVGNNRVVGNRCTGLGGGCPGIRCLGAGSALFAERNEVSGNDIGFSQQGGCAFNSLGNNTVEGNGTNVNGVIGSAILR